MNVVVVGRVILLISFLHVFFTYQCTAKKKKNLWLKKDLKLERNEFHLRSLQGWGERWLHLCGVSLLTVCIIFSP